MKKIFSRILAVGLLSAGIIGVSSCDYLDGEPENYGYDLGNPCGGGSLFI